MRVRLLPEAPSYARSSAERALSCDGRGRWFESSRAYHFADVAQKEEHRDATPGTPVRSGSSASVGPWCNGSTTSSNLVGPGSTPGGPAATEDRRGPVRLGYLWAERPSGRAVSKPRTRPHLTTATYVLLRAGTVPVIDPYRQVAGSSPARSVACSGSSVGRAVPGCTTTTAAVA